MGRILSIGIALHFGAMLGSFFPCFLSLAYGEGLGDCVGPMPLVLLLFFGVLSLAGIIGGISGTLFGVDHTPTCSSALRKVPFFGLVVASVLVGFGLGVGQLVGFAGPFQSGYLRILVTALAGFVVHFVFSWLTAWLARASWPIA